MRLVPNAVEATLAAIALYFALVWGVEALHVLASTTYGLGDYGRSQVVYGYGRIFNLSSDGLVRIAAFFAASKLAAAIAFALHLVERLRTFPGKADHEMLEAALLIVVLLTLVMALPATIDNNGSLIRLHGLYLLLAGVAAMLCAIEHFAATEPSAARTGQLLPAEPVGTEIAERGDVRKRVMMWLWANAGKPAA